MLIVGNSVLAGKYERWITQSKVKLRYFPGATTQEYVRPSKTILKKPPNPSFLILGLTNKSAIKLLDGILSGKQLIKKSLPH